MFGMNTARLAIVQRASFWNAAKPTVRAELGYPVRIDNRAVGPKDVDYIVSMGSSMEKKPVRRIVTGHDADGKAALLMDGPTPYVNQRGEGNVVSNIWITNESPVDLSHTRDQANQKTGVPPPKAGSICRVVDFAPYDGKVPQGVDHHAILRQMGIDPATQGYQRHIFTHRTRSIDYAIVLEGEIDMLLDDTEVHCKAGDILVQQGTNHAWVNNSGKPCRICFVLIDSHDPPAWKKDWKPKK